LNTSNKPVSKPKKTKEDIINEAKLALEAKALTSKAVIAELEKINKMSDTKGKESLRSKVSLKMSKTLKSVGPTSYLSRLLTNRNRQKTAKNNKNMSEKQLLFIQNEFTPSSMTVSLTDEKIYKK
jgi:rRNA-processing protein FCF1